MLSLFVLTLGLGSCSKYYFNQRPQTLWQKTIDEHQVYDVGIVTGYPFNGQHWDTLVRDRLLWAKYLLDKGVIKHIILSGAAVHSPYIEAVYMKRYALALGIPEQQISLETKAEHSVENIFYSYQLARKLGFKSIALCTDPLQSILTKRFTVRRFATDIPHLPIVYDSIKALRDIPVVIEHEDLKITPFVPLKERESKLKSFRATLGNHIPWQGEKPARPL